MRERKKNTRSFWTHIFAHILFVLAVHCCMRIKWVRFRVDQFVNKKKIEKNLRVKDRTFARNNNAIENFMKIKSDWKYKKSKLRDNFGWSNDCSASAHLNKTIFGRTKQSFLEHFGGKSRPKGGEINILRFVCIKVLRLNF